MFFYRKSQPTILKFVNFWKHWHETNDKSCKQIEKFLNPLPIQNPVFITVLVYNRDVDAPLPIDSKVCHEILESIENYIEAKKGASVSENEDLRHYVDVEASTDDGGDVISTQRNGLEVDKISHDSFMYPKSLCSDESNNPITWTLSNNLDSIEINQIQKHDSFSQIGLASPEEDISISMDEHHIFGANKNFEFGTNV